MHSLIRTIRRKSTHGKMKICGEKFRSHQVPGRRYLAMIKHRQPETSGCPRRYVVPRGDRLEEQCGVAHLAQAAAFSLLDREEEKRGFPRPLYPLLCEHSE